MQTSTRHKPGKRGANVVNTVAGISIMRLRDGFFIRIRREGHKERKFFHTFEAADLYRRTLASKQTKEGLHAFNLTPAERDDARKALDRLAGRATLAQAVDAWLKLHPEAGAHTVRDMIRSYLADLPRNGYRADTIRDRRTRLARFEETFGPRPLSGVTWQDLDGWLVAQSAGSYRQYRSVLSAFFAHAKNAGILDGNPVAQLPQRKTRRDDAAPVYWPAERIAAMMQTAQRHFPGLVPFLAVGAFAGLRPDEAGALRWDDIDLAAGALVVRSETSKTRKARRIEPLAANLVRWLLPYRQNAAPIAPPRETRDKHRDAVLAAMALGEKETARRRADGHAWERIVADWKASTKGGRWEQNVLRHSYASHALAVTPDFARLAVTMGNSETVLRTHYVAYPTAAAGRRYFEIVPEGGKVIPFEVAG